MKSNNVKLIWITPEAEKVIGYCARVSNPANQDNENVAGLLSYCMKHGHWSVFEMASMCVEIDTSRAISAQILRHRSFSFQEFSQRYAEVAPYSKLYDARRQDIKNRQNSIDDLSDETKVYFTKCQLQVQELSHKYYRECLEKGVAKECARMLLPMATETKLYMTGSIRSWIHYFKLRCDKATQLEHRVIADEIKDTFCRYLPTIGELLEHVQ